MLFTCPGNVARGGQQRPVKGRRRHVCVDVHCHVHYPPADEMVKHAFSPDQEPMARFANELTRLTNGKQMENVRVCLTSADTIVFDRDQLRHLVNLWGADHIVVGTDYPYDMGWYDPRGFVDGADFLKDADKAKIMGLNAAKLLKITSRLGSMGIPQAKARRKP